METQIVLIDVHKFPMPKASASATARPSRREVKPAWHLNAKQKTSPNALAFGKRDRASRPLARKPARRLSAKQIISPMPSASASATARRARLRVKPARRLSAKQKIGFLSHG